MSEVLPRRKIAHKTNAAKNRLQDKPKNRPHDGLKNRPDIINPVPLLGVVCELGIKALLVRKKQTSWCTRLRTLGLLLLIDYICRHLKRGQISMSADLAHQFVSKLRNSRSGTIITEPLLLLCGIGILRTVHPAVFAHIKTSAVYCFADPYSKNPFRLEVVLTPKLAQKLASANDRRENRLNRKYPFRKQLLTDLAAVSFSDSARRLIGNGLLGKSGENLKRLVSAVDAQLHFVIVSERGQITTSLGSCPREIQSHLLLHGSPIVSCDIQTRIGISCRASL